MSRPTVSFSVLSGPPLSPYLDGPPLLPHGTSVVVRPHVRRLKKVSVLYFLETCRTVDEGTGINWGDVGEHAWRIKISE